MLQDVPSSVTLIHAITYPLATIYHPPCNSRRVSIYYSFYPVHTIAASSRWMLLWRRTMAGSYVLEFSS